MSDGDGKPAEDDGPPECPICGFYFVGGECVGCGYEEKADERE